MTDTTAELLARALALPVHERAWLVFELVQSLDLDALAPESIHDLETRVEVAPVDGAVAADEWQDVLERLRRARARSSGP